MNEQYLTYLQSRSKLSLFYRQYILYLKLCKFLKGNALDIGCGLGDFLKFRKKTIGVDVNPSIVEWCKNQNLDVKLQINDTFPFDDKSFSSIILDNVLEHIEFPNKLLSEVNRVHVEGGSLIIGVPGELGYDQDTDHKVFYTEEKLIKKISSYGYKVEKVFYTPLNFSLLSYLIKQHCVYALFSKKYTLL
jgi:SAM-dependent methyltransferase